MAQEFETQIINIDVDEVTKKLRELGAEEEEELLQRRWVFDIVPETAECTGEWVRLRQAGDKKPRLTYKHKVGNGFSETEELEVEVSDFDEMAEILERFKLPTKYYQENKRKTFTYKDIEFTLDTWPKIPTMLEIEAKSEDKVKEGLKLLDLEGKDLGHVGLVHIYSKYYGMKLHDNLELKFD